MGDWFLALDGDDVGRRLEKYMLMNDACSLKNFSSEFEDVVAVLIKKVSSIPDLEILLSGGDSILIQMGKSSIEHVLVVVENSLQDCQFTFSGGYGPSMRSAYLSLKLAKSKGKNRIEGPLGEG